MDISPPHRVVSRIVVVSLLALIIVSGPAAGLTPGSVTTSYAQQDDAALEGPNVEACSPDPGEIIIAATHGPHPAENTTEASVAIIMGKGIQEVQVYIDDATATTAGDLGVDPTVGGTTLTASALNEEDEVSVVSGAVLEIDAASTSERFGGVKGGEGDGYTVTQLDYGEYEYRYDGGRLSKDQISLQVTSRVPGPGFGGGSRALIGDAAVATRNTSDEKIRVAVPESVDSRWAKATGYAKLVTQASEMLDIGGTGTQYNPCGTTVSSGEKKVVTGIHAPIINGGEVKGSEPAYVVASGDDSGFVILHEYVHTRQQFETTDETRWLTEGSAEYYEHYLGWKIGPDDVDDFFRSGDLHNDVKLDTPETWSGTDADYDRGAAVLRALDGRIRSETDGEKTLEDVMQRLNEHDGSVTNRDFRIAAQEVAGTDLSRFWNDYIEGSKAPPTPEQGLFVEISSGDDTTTTPTDTSPRSSNGGDRTTQRATSTPTETTPTQTTTPISDATATADDSTNKSDAQTGQQVANPSAQSGLLSGLIDWASGFGVTETAFIFMTGAIGLGWIFLFIKKLASVLISVLR